MMLKLFLFAGTVSPSLCFLSRCSLLLCLFCSPNSLYWVLLPVSRYSWFVLACFLLVLSCCPPLSLCWACQLCVLLCVTPGLLDVWIPRCFEISLLHSKISIKGSLYILLLCPESPTACSQLNLTYRAVNEQNRSPLNRRTWPKWLTLMIFLIIPGLLLTWHFSCFQVASM